MMTTTQIAAVRSEEFDICRSLARDARVFFSFAFWPRLELFPAGRRTPSTLTEAVELLIASPTGRLVVMFEWKLCEEFGQEEIEFNRSMHPTGTEKFIRQMIENSITEKIANSIYSDTFANVVMA
jgi:hypothetical protein